jgi:hypothetical protein
MTADDVLLQEGPDQEAGSDLSDTELGRGRDSLQAAAVAHLEPFATRPASSGA